MLKTQPTELYEVDLAALEVEHAHDVLYAPLELRPLVAIFSKCIEKIGGFES